MKSSDVFKGNFLKADDLQNRRVRVTIMSVEMEDIGHDDKKERRAVAHFVGKEKGLVLNKTNWSILEEVCASHDSDDWIGVIITLHVVKVDYQGKRVPAIRVSDVAGETTLPPKARQPGEDDDAPDDVTADEIGF